MIGEIKIIALHNKILDYYVHCAFHPDDMHVIIGV